MHNDIYDMLPHTITEQYDWQNKSVINDFSDHSGRTWHIILERNSADGSFNVKDDGESPYNSTKHSFSVNNKPFEIGNPDSEHYFNAHSSMFNSIALSKVQSLGVTMQSPGMNFFSSFSFFPRKHPFNKNIVLYSNEYLRVRSIKTIEFDIKITGSKETQYVNDPFPKVSYTETYIVPHYFDPVNPTDKLFDIYVKNTNKDTKIAGDIAFNDGEMTTSATGSTKFKLNTISQLGEIKEFGQSPIVSTVCVFDQTRYDYEKEKVEVGYGKDSINGVLVPYNFKGEYKRTFDISPNKPFEHLNITLSNDIPEPTLDPYEGNIILQIKNLDYKSYDDVPAVPWRIISSENFERFKDINPSIVGINRLSYEENI